MWDRIIGLWAAGSGCYYFMLGRSTPQLQSSGGGLPKTCFLKYTFQGRSPPWQILHRGVREVGGQKTDEPKTDVPHTDIK